MGRILRIITHHRLVEAVTKSFSYKLMIVSWKILEKRPKSSSIWNEFKWKVKSEIYNDMMGVFFLRNLLKRLLLSIDSGWNFHFHSHYRPIWWNLRATKQHCEDPLRHTKRHIIRILRMKQQSVHWAQWKSIICTDFIFRVRAGWENIPLLFLWYVLLVPDRHSLLDVMKIKLSLTIHCGQINWSGRDIPPSSSRIRKVWTFVI